MLGRREWNCDRGTRSGSLPSSCWRDRLLILPSNFRASVKRARRFVYFKVFWNKMHPGIRLLGAILGKI